MEHCAFDCLAVTSVRIFPQNDTRVKAFATVVLNDQLIIKGLNVCDGENGLYVTYPRGYMADAERSWIFPVTRQLREHIENCVLEKFQAAIGSTEAPKRDDSQFAVVETIDYNNGETPAESNILAIDSRQVCVERFAELKAEIIAAGKELLDESDNFFRFEDEETGERRSYAIKPPKAK